MTETTIDRIVLMLPPGTPRVEHGHWQRRAETALRAVAWTPPGMPPSAILLIRRLADPAPGLLLQGQPWQAAQRWEAQVRPALQTLWRSAARPAYGPVASNAAAVWFADQAEWLACLTHDLHLGIADQRWWWQSWCAHHRSTERTLPALWRAQAMWLPAALALLHQQVGSGLADIGRQLDHVTLTQLWAALATAYALPEAFNFSTAQEAQFRSLLPGSSQREAAPFTSRKDTTPANTFLTAALALHHAPSAVRHLLCTTSQSDEPNGTVATAAATRAAMVPTPVDRKNTGVTQSHAAAATSPAQSNPATPHQRPAPHEPLRAESEETRPDQPEQPTTPIKQAEDNEFFVDRDHATAPAAATEALSSNGALSIQPTTGDATVLPTMTTVTSTGLATILEQGPNGIHTALGGVWYLVNVITALDLWPQCPAGMGAWRLLTELAARLWGERPPDPLWNLLDALDAGEAVVEQSTTWSAWLATTVPLVATWLAKQLTTPALPAAESPVISAMLRRPAMLWITRTHVDISFPLAQIDLQVRLAGLDRNPGWVPALGRVVTFYFG